jgi:hypothetical protein
MRWWLWRGIKVAIWTVSVLIAAAGGVWFGFLWRNPPIDWNIMVSVTCGGGNYPKEAFRKVNDEMNAKIDSLVGEHASRHWATRYPPRVEFGG